MHDAKCKGTVNEAIKQTSGKTKNLKNTYRFIIYSASIILR